MEHVTSHPERRLLLDISRLLWRAWRGFLPTGIDRVCLEYVRRFGPSSLALLQFNGRILVFGARDSNRLFSLLLREGGAGRASLVAALARALPRLSRSAPQREMIYLNVGHTGLHDPALGEWVEANRCRAVYLIHDLIPITHPQFCREGEAARHEARMRNALRSASRIIGNSKATLDELTIFASNQMLAMPPAIPAFISGWRSVERHFAPRPDRPYFVVVGTIEGRKNHLLLLNVWKRLASEMGSDTPVLVIVGQRGWQAEKAIAMLDNPDGLRDHVRELSACGDAELQDLLSSARALLMPSFAEGFGLPVIEALGTGTPVIAADLPVYREVVGDIPIYLDPADEAAWEKAVKSFAGDGPERKRQKEAMSTFNPPSWGQHFAIVEKWLAEID